METGDSFAYKVLKNSIFSRVLWSCNSAINGWTQLYSVGHDRDPRPLLLSFLHFLFVDDMIFNHTGFPEKAHR